MRFATEVRWRISKRGLVLALPGGEALLLEHPAAATLPELLETEPAFEDLADALDDAAGITNPRERAEHRESNRYEGHAPDVFAEDTAPEQRPQDPADVRTDLTPEVAPGRDLLEQMLELGVLDETPTGAASTDSDQSSGLERSEAKSRHAAQPISSPTKRVQFSRSGVEVAGIDVPARWLYRYLGPVVLNRVVQLLLVAVVLAGITALIMGRPPGPTVSDHPAIDALLGLLLVLFMAAAHETAHAVALVHYGGRPNRAGFGFYWGSICFYVDSTDAVTLPRRARVTQALAGLGVDLVAISVLAITAQLSHVVLITAVCWRLAVLSVVDLVTNAAPILELDGHWALADFLDEPDLALRARAAFGARLRRRPAPRGLALYGAASLVGGALLLVGGALVWWYAAGDLITALFTGNLADTIIGLYVVVPFVLSLLASLVGLLGEVLASPATQQISTPTLPQDPKAHSGRHQARSHRPDSTLTDTARPGAEAPIPTSFAATTPVASTAAVWAPCLDIRLQDGSRARSLRHHREFLIGRDLDNDLRVDNRSVSRHHARLVPWQDGWDVVNHSANGILVDGRPTERHRLSGPTTITLGHQPDAPQVQIVPGNSPAVSFGLRPIPAGSITSSSTAVHRPIHRSARPAAAPVAAPSDSPGQLPADETATRP